MANKAEQVTRSPHVVLLLFGFDSARIWLETCRASFRESPVFRRSPKESMKTVANLGSIQQAQNLKLVLGSMGIDSFIPDEVSAGVAPHLFATRVGIRLQVDDKDEEEAKRIIQEGSDNSKAE